MLKINEITSFEEFNKLQVEWNELLSQCENDSVFLRHEWFEVWWKHFGENKQLFILLAHEVGRLVGIAPLMLLTEKIGNIRPFATRQIRFIENSVAPHTDFIIKNYRIDVLRAIFNHLESIRHKWNIIILNKLPRESLIFSKNPNLYRSGLRFEVQQVINNPVLRPTCEWNSYFSSRSRRVRGSVRNSRNKIEKAGTINIENITSASNGKPFLQKIWDISQHSWKNTLNVGIARSENYQKFYSDLTNIAKKNRWLSLWLLSKDQTPIAFEYHLRYKNKIYGLCSEFNKDYSNYSPGFVLDAHIIENLFSSGVQEYDMGPKEDFYKMRWTDTVRQHKVMYIFNSNFLSKLLYLIEFIFFNHFSQFRLVIKLKDRRIEGAKKA